MMHIISNLIEAPMVLRKAELIPLHDVSGSLIEAIGPIWGWSILL